MIRIFFTYVFPLLLPTLVYMAWVSHARRKHDADNDDDPPGLRRGPLFWSLVAGLVLMLAGLTVIALTSGDPPGSGAYQSPRLEDGKVVPPTYKKP